MPREDSTRLSRWLDRLRGRPVEWDLARYCARIAAIDARATELGVARLSDVEITAQASRLRDRAGDGLASRLAAELFALAREAASRALGLRLHDEQLIAALALHDGKLVQLQTGEGKTLAAVLPAALGGMTGRGVHLLTFNDYLARRDAAWMGPVYDLLGVSAAHVAPGMGRDERRRAYAADVTYVTAKEAGYDLLRAGLARTPDEQVQRPFHMAIVDEADSIMIDEARTPLVIAGAAPDAAFGARGWLAEIVRGLEPGAHFERDEHGRNAYLTPAGEQRVSTLTGAADLRDAEHRELLTGINQALHARELLVRGVDYIVRDGKVVMVDELTGRVVPDRHWPDGLHRAVEAKEGLAQVDEGRVLGSITLQHFLGLYPRLAGMTGTALPADEELHQLYGLTTVVVPPHRACARVDFRLAWFVSLF